MKCYWFVFCKTDLVLEKTDIGYTIPLSEECPIPLKAWSQVLSIEAMPEGESVKAVNIDMPVTNNPKLEMCGLRASYYKLNTEFYLKAGVCGSPMKLHTEISKRCTNCGKEVWHNFLLPLLC